MTALTAIVATLGTLVVLGAWWGCHWLARRLDRDDRKAEGYER
jgi:hypothetical protein